MQLRTYTFVLDYRGGTYIEQVRARDPDSAALEWARRLDLAAIGVSEGWRDRLVSEVVEETAVPIIGVESTWCISPYIEQTMAIVHLVETAVSPGS